MPELNGNVGDVTFEISEYGAECDGAADPYRPIAYYCIAKFELPWPKSDRPHVEDEVRIATVGRSALEARQKFLTKLESVIAAAQEAQRQLQLTPVPEYDEDEIED